MICKNLNYIGSLVYCCLLQRFVSCFFLYFLESMNCKNKLKTTRVINLNSHWRIIFLASFNAEKTVNFWIRHQSNVYMLNLRGWILTTLVIFYLNTFINYSDKRHTLYSCLLSAMKALLLFWFCGTSSHHRV